MTSALQWYAGIAALFALVTVIYACVWSDGANELATKAARGLLGSAVWPLMLLWWARPSWLWREQHVSLGELSRLHAIIEERDAEIAKLRAERGGFR